MSHPPPNYNMGRSSRSSPPSDSLSGQSYSDPGRTTLPPLTIAFPTTDLPGHNNYLYPYPTHQRPTTPASSQQHYYQPAQQQTQAPYTYSSYPPPPEQPRHGGQAYSSHNSSRVSPSFNSADPRRHPPPPPPLSVPPREGWPGSQYYSTHPDPQTQHTPNDMRSPHAAYHHTSGYPQQYQSQHQSLAATAYSGHHRGAPPPAAVASQQYYQPQSTSMSRRTMPSSRTSAQLPYPPPDIVTEEVVIPDSAEPVIKKKRKRADAQQLEVLNSTYARTAFPSTEERAELARRLGMQPRQVQIWFQNKRQQARQVGRNTAGTSSISVPPPAPTPTPSSGYRGSPGPVSPMVETSGPTYSSRSPPPAMMRSGQTPSPPRPDYSRHWRGGGY